jgi:hypothetical protein
MSDNSVQNAGRYIIDALAFLKVAVASNKRMGRHTAAFMTDVAAAFPSATQATVLQMLTRNQTYPPIVRWVDKWLMKREI